MERSSPYAVFQRLESRPPITTAKKNGDESSHGKITPLQRLRTFLNISPELAKDKKPQNR